MSAPAHHRISAAVALLDAAARGEVTLHVPSFCFSEAKPSVREKQPRREADAIREYLRYSRVRAPIEIEEEQVKLRSE